MKSELVNIISSWIQGAAGSAIAVIVDRSPSRRNNQRHDAMELAHRQPDDRPDQTSDTPQSERALIGPPATNNLRRSMDLEWLREEGFEGFIAFSDVARGLVSTSIGVYAVVRVSTDEPAFRVPGTGRPGSDYSLERLHDAWVPGAHILYLGKADCAGGLLERLTKYKRFGKGKRSGHSGGRAIWQLADAADLKVCWLATPGQDPETVESAFIKDFKDRHHQMRPFANQNDGRKSS